MGRVKVLPEVLAHKIAAGEIVERPASVVKELVENALDAESTRIHIEIQDAGQRLIRVRDDGSGMSPEDALLAFQHHATSKIQTMADLDQISTLGFRGEALPSIASVVAAYPCEPSIARLPKALRHWGLRSSFRAVRSFTRKRSPGRQELKLQLKIYSLMYR